MDSEFYFWICLSAGVPIALVAIWLYEHRKKR